MMDLIDFPVTMIPRHSHIDTAMTEDVTEVVDGGFKYSFTHLPSSAEGLGLTLVECFNLNDIFREGVYNVNAYWSMACYWHPGHTVGQVIDMAGACYDSAYRLANEVEGSC